MALPSLRILHFCTLEQQSLRLTVPFRLCNFKLSFFILGGLNCKLASVWSFEPSNQSYHLRSQTPLVIGKYSLSISGASRWSAYGWWQETLLLECKKWPWRWHRHWVIGHFIDWYRLRSDVNNGQSQNHPHRQGGGNETRSDTSPAQAFKEKDWSRLPTIWKQWFQSHVGFAASFPVNCLRMHFCITMLSGPNLPLKSAFKITFAPAIGSKTPCTNPKAITRTISFPKRAHLA